VTNNMIVRRSWLVVPAYDVDAIGHAQKYSPDVLVLDLEYMVAPKHKQEARAVLGSAIRSATESPSEVFVRVDWKTRWCDVKAAIYPELRGIVLPGPELAEEIVDLDKLISECEHQRGVMPGSTELALILESPRGFWNVFKLATASSRVTAVGVGRVDLTMHLGREPQGDFRLYLYLMSRTLVVARALGKQPLGAHWRPGSRGGIASLKDSFEAARRSWRMGFTGCLCAKPEQVIPVSEGFTPPSDEVKKADHVLQAYQQDLQTGQFLVEVDDRTYDTFKIARCQNILTFAQACAKRDEDKKLSMELETQQ